MDGAVIYDFHSINLVKITGCYTVVFIIALSTITGDGNGCSVLYTPGDIIGCFLSNIPGNIIGCSIQYTL